MAQQRVQQAVAQYIESLYNKADVKITKTLESDKLLEEAAAKQAAAKPEETKPAAK